MQWAQQYNMGLLRNILKELRTPSDQGKDWYGWATNQCAHVFLGVVFCGTLIALKIPAIFAALFTMGGFTIFELKMLLANLSWRVAFDKLNDIFFIYSGVALSFFLYKKMVLHFLCVVFGIAILQVVGILPRVHKALKCMRGKKHE